MLKCAFILGSPDISGGTYVIFQHALYMQKHGVDVTIITQDKVPADRLFWYPEAKNLSWLTFSETGEMQFDIVYATWWRTVYELHRVKAKTYAYFVQSIEDRFYPEKETALRKLVAATYTLDLAMVTAPKWIVKYLKENYNQEVPFVSNGIRKDIYQASGSSVAPREKGKLRVLVEGPVDVDFKNIPRTVALCRKSQADEIWMLTSSDITKYPGVDKVFAKVPVQDTPLIYRSCDVIVKLSYVEGMFGPPLEMFHCGGTAIVYDVTGHDEYIIHQQNGLVVHMDHENQVVEYINKLKTDPALLARLKTNALKTAAAWPDWDKSSAQFLAVTKNFVATRHNDNVADLSKKTKFFMDWYEKHNQLLLEQKKTYWKLANKIRNLVNDNIITNKLIKVIRHGKN